MGFIKQKTMRVSPYLIYLASSFFILFVVIKETTNSDLLPALLGSCGGVFTLWRFLKGLDEDPFKELFVCLKDDYGFEKYTFPKMASIFYSIAQGACLGSSLGFSIDWIHSLVNQRPYANSYLGSIFFSLLTLVFTRVLLELCSSFLKSTISIKKSSLDQG